MRNLKRALSMALASVMMIGMMAIGAGATSYEDFADKDEIQNREAVNTMVSLGVISGTDNGTYEPNGTLTRAQMCTLIARMLGGGKDPVLGNGGKSNFKDTQGHWAEQYIAYCANLGIIAGVGDGNFKPDDALNGTAAAKMILCALGYKPEFEGIGGANWELATNTLASKVGLYENLDTLNPSVTINRDDVAQMIYNGVQANEVEYRNLMGQHDGTVYATEIGTMLWNRFQVHKVTGILVANDKISVDGDPAALAGKSRLYLEEIYTTSSGNTASRWVSPTYTVETPDEMVGQEIVLYVRELNALSPNASTATVVSEPIITDKNTVVETSARLKDADAVRKALRDGGLTGIRSTGAADAQTVAVLYDETGYQTGVNTGITDTIAAKFRSSNTDRSAGIFQRFIDNDNDGTVDYILQVVPVLTSVNSINSAGDKLTFTGVTGTIDAEDIVTELDLARNDVVLMTKYADGCYYITEPETVEGVVTAYNTNNNKVTVDGESYGNSGGKMLNVPGVDQFLTEEETIDGTFLFYLDDAGNVLGYKETEAVIGNYAVVRGMSRSGNPTMGWSARVKVLMQDGTTATYDLNLAGSAVNLGLASASDSDSAKENAMVGTDYVDDTYNATNLMIDHLFSYTLDGNTITLGRPQNMNDNYTSNYVDVHDVLQTVGELNETRIAKNTARYEIDNGNDYVVANDQTVFFIKDKNNDYFVVTGLSKLPTNNVAVTAGEAIAYTAPGGSTKIAKAIFVESSDEFKSVRDYVFVTDKYTRTNASGTPVYTFSVVSADGTVSKMDTKSSNFNQLKNTVREFDYSGKYVNFYAVTPDYNGLYVQEVNANTVTLGDPDTGKEVISLRVNSTANIWDVQGDDPAEDVLSENDVVSVMLDNEGAVKAIFIYDVMNGAFAPAPSSSDVKIDFGNGDVAPGSAIDAAPGTQLELALEVEEDVTPTAKVNGTSVTMRKAPTRSLVKWIGTYTLQLADIKTGELVVAFTTKKDGMDPITTTFTYNLTYDYETAADTVAIAVNP